MAAVPLTDGERSTPTPAATLCAAFQSTAERVPDVVALRTPGAGVEITWSEYAERVRALAGGLAAHGIGSRDTVAMMLTNRPEAHLIDVAALHLGATPFSIYSTSAPDQIEYVFRNAECTVAVTERQFLDPVLAARRALPALRHVFVVDGPYPGATDLCELEAAADPGFDFDASWRAVTPEHVAALIYTSGTTGPPKGVELIHANLLWEVTSLLSLADLPAEPRFMSYLPMAHLADRVVAHYPALVTGGSVTCCDPKLAVDALRDVRPSLWLGVPRVWEKLKAALETRFPEALATGGDRADAELLKRLREQIGLDAAAFLLTGAAPILPEVIEFFVALGLPLYELWGMTESSAAATANRMGANKIGTVGRPLPGAEVALADDGELLIRGPLVMRGYRSDPAKTAEAIDADGWLHTGDVGEIDADGYVSIVDRKKELIINAAGKNMSPANVEAVIKAACPLIGIAVAIGDARPYNTALLVLEPEAVASFAAEHGIGDGSLAELAGDALVREEVAAGVERANARLSRVEQIKKHTIIPGEWVAGGDELTPTLKLKRKPIGEKYRATIEAMY
jgi:long-subunit acyl-CoA synthetase (AMP-forming)